MHPGTLFFVFLLLVSCQNQPSISEKMVPKTFEDDDANYDKWTSQLIANPLTQDQIDKNTIINYILDNKLDMKMTKSGLFYQLIEQGEGKLAKWGNYVTVHYSGYTLDGKEFDSSYNRHQAFQFYIGNMIPGWNEGLQLLNAGSKVLFLISSKLAYGEKGHPAGIPPHTILAFEIHLLKIEDKKKLPF